MSKYIYNNTQEEKTYIGKSIDAESYYLIQAHLEVAFSAESALLVDIANGDIIVSKSDDSSGHIANINSAIDFLKGNLPQLVESTNYPFASKVLPSGKRLYQRVHGMSASVAGSPDNITFTVPYSACKLTEIEILNGDLGDKVNFKILDDTSGTYTTVPNYQLNQFGFDVNIAEKYYSRKSNYDADLYYGMQVRLEYDAINSDLLPKTIYLNIILHEVKT